MIEDKMLVMAIRYSVAGQDFWDNNNGRNYMAIFTMSKAHFATSRYSRLAQRT
jgi:Carbohydrate/starch-binding module (family 21)